MATLAAPAAPPLEVNTSSADLPPEAEAARYALLRRLGPALRHDLVVHLQAVAMMAEVLSARLARTDDPTDLHQALARMHQLARDAIAGALQVAGWIAPPEDDAVDLRQGLEENLALVRSSLGFRGMRLLAELPDAGLPVSRDKLRYMLLSSLLHLSDQGGPTGTLRVQARIEADGALIRLTLDARNGSVGGRGNDRACEANEANERAESAESEDSAESAESSEWGEGGDGYDGRRWSTFAPGEEAGYRPLRWDDVQVLGAGLSLLRQFTPTRIELRLPRAEARTPLQVAPR